MGAGVTEVSVSSRPFADDTPMSLPIPWQTWIQDELERGNQDTKGVGRGPPTKEGLEDASAAPRQTLTLTNPFGNLADLEALKHSFAEQLNFKAALVEGESWEGIAEENVAKWRGLMHSWVPTTGVIQNEFEVAFLSRASRFSVRA
ncbi:hypothetical protein D9615_006279 [Tricholomella constricta]|uniref:Uncharacterized protein n=1 Tax=Tricholomella constricta TaxID=117010 RepID=A0A8H5HBH7_9AGAR|nr:hypothetical protein D9615_006279 [Tricholomella constricta]